MTEAKKKESLADAIQRCREDEPSLAHSPRLIAEYIGTDEGSVKVHLNNMEHQELAAEVAKLPDSFEKRTILNNLKNVHTTTDDVFNLMGINAKKKSANAKDIAAYVAVGRFLLETIKCQLQALDKDSKKISSSHDYKAKRTTRTSDMKPQAAMRH